MPYKVGDIVVIVELDPGDYNHDTILGKEYVVTKIVTEELNPGLYNLGYRVMIRGEHWPRVYLHQREFAVKE